jgi:cation diffusion facilitator family transporter
MPNRYPDIKRATFLDIAKNLTLGASKIILGWLGQSHALMADGIHSFADLLTDFLVLLGAKYGSQRADADHPYGHARFETIASLGLSLILILTGLGIIIHAGGNLRSPSYLETPAFFVLGVAVFSIVLNEWIYRYTHRLAKKIGSDLLLANALHSRSDVISSIVVLVGVAGSLLGLTYMDAVAALILGLFIIKMGGEITWRNVMELVDTGLDAQTIEILHKAIFNVPGVKSIHELRSRRMAGRALLEVHIIVDPTLTVSEGHHIGEKVTEVLQAKLDLLDNVIVHIDSENDEDYSSTKSLPLRANLMPLLTQSWLLLPGFEKRGLIKLHYLMGKISIELELPHDIITPPLSVENLTNQYQQAIKSLIYIKEVKLVFF